MSLSDLSYSQNFLGQNFRQRVITSSILFDFCLTFVLTNWTKSSKEKIFVNKSNFRQLCSTNFCPIMYAAFNCEHGIAFERLTGKTVCQNVWTSITGKMAIPWYSEPDSYASK